MEKISGILPRSGRVSRVDLKGSSVRSGMPSFGQKVAKSSLNGNKMAMSTAEKAVAEWNRLKDERTRRQEKIVTDIAKEFFQAPPIPQIGAGEQPIQPIGDLDTVSKVGTMDVGSSAVGELSSAPETIQELSQNLVQAQSEMAPEEYLDMPEKGGYLNVVA